MKPLRAQTMSLHIATTMLLVLGFVKAAEYMEELDVQVGSTVFRTSVPSLACLPCGNNR